MSRIERAFDINISLEFWLFEFEPFSILCSPYLSTGIKFPVATIISNAKVKETKHLPSKITMKCFKTRITFRPRDINYVVCSKTVSTIQVC